MHSSSSKPPSRVDLNFEVVIAFDYYDGPESGLAISTSGVGVRFSSVGDSASRLQRGFELEAIKGDWWPLIKDLIQQEGLSAPRRIIVPGPSETLTRLMDSVATEAATGQYVAVGGPDLSRLSIVALKEPELAQLRQAANSKDGFQLANSLIRGSKPPKGFAE